MESWDNLNSSLTEVSEKDFEQISLINRISVKLALMEETLISRNDKYQ